jgi:hypothetical protein
MNPAATSALTGIEQLRAFFAGGMPQRGMGATLRFSSIDIDAGGRLCATATSTLLVFEL